MRKVSLDAGLGPGYVHSILMDGKEPSITRLEAVCHAVNVSVYYVIFGVEISPKAEQIISLLDGKPEKMEAILSCFPNSAFNHLLDFVRPKIQPEQP